MEGDIIEKSATQESSATHPEDSLLEGISKLGMKEGTPAQGVNRANEDESAHQSYFTWADPETAVGNLTPSDVAKLLLDNSLKEKNDQLKILQYTAIKHISFLGIVAYQFALLKQFEEASVTVAEAKYMMEVCSIRKFVPNDYLKGFTYVFDCLDAYIATESKVMSAKELLEKWEGLSKFASLDAKVQVGVWAMKLYFFEHLYKKEEEIEIVEKMIEMDPDFPEWHYFLATLLRTQRRAEDKNNWRVSSKVYGAELKELAKANKLDPDHPLFRLEFCKLIAEFSKRGWVDRNQPLVVENYSFNRMDDVAKFLREECSKILELFSQSVRVNLGIAEIYLKWLPPRCRDYELTFECLKRALKVRPNGTKANHYMGIYYLVSDRNNLAEAEKYLTLSVDADSGNYAALSDLVQLLLRTPNQNVAKIRELLKRYLNDPSPKISLSWRAKLLYLKGCFLHLIGCKHEECISALIEAEIISGDPLPFHINMHKRYHWPIQHLHPAGFLKTLERAKENQAYLEKNATGLEKLSKTLENAVKMFERDDRNKIRPGPREDSNMNGSNENDSNATNNGHGKDRELAVPLNNIANEPPAQFLTAEEPNNDSYFSPKVGIGRGRGRGRPLAALVEDNQGPKKVSLYETLMRMEASGGSGQVPPQFANGRSDESIDNENERSPEEPGRTWPRPGKGRGYSSKGPKYAGGPGRVNPFATRASSEQRSSDELIYNGEE